VTSVDRLVEGSNTQLLEPLRETWFSADGGKGIGASFVDPLVEQVLDPLEAHLEDLVVLADVWQDWLLAPTHLALEERARVCEGIAQCKAASRSGWDTEFLSGNSSCLREGYPRAFGRRRNAR
jgi:hypothetical protein